MGQFASDIHAATAAIPAAPATDPAQLLDGPELLAIFARVEAAVAALELRAAGSRIRRGAGAPANALGNEQDLYVNTQNGDLWGKDAGVWALLLNLRGPKGADATGGPGKSAYELAVQQGFQGSVDQWLASLGRAGAAGQSAYLLAVQLGFVGAPADWVASLKGAPGKAADPAVLGAGSVGNEQLAADVKVGSLSAAGNAYPAADRAGLTTVEKFLVWIGGKITAFEARIKAVEDRPTTTTGGGGYSLPQAAAGTLGGVKGAGAGLLGNVVVNEDGSMSAPATNNTGGYTDAQAVSANAGLIGALSALTTTAKNTIVAAINELVSAVNGKVDKLAGYGLSKNDYTDPEKAKLAALQPGVAGGYAPLGTDAKIAALYLPSYVDDVLEVANFAALPGTGESGKIYVTADTNGVYRWTGSAYVQLVGSPGSTDAVPEGPTNKYFTGPRVLAALLAGYAKNATNRALAVTDSVLVSFGVLEKKIDDNAAALTAKADLVGGLVPVAQLPAVTRLTFLFPAGQQTQLQVLLAFTDQVGTYAIEMNSQVTGVAAYKNGTQIVLSSTTYALGDVLALTGTVAGGISNAYVTLRKQ